MTDDSGKYSVTIVGGGLLGLCIAYFMARSGVRKVAVIEASEQLGGACSWIRVDGTLADRFYHVIMAEDGSIFRLMDELGLGGQYGFTTTRMGIFDGSASHPIGTAKEFLFYPNISIINKLRLAYTILHCQAFRDWQEIESLSAPAWLTKIGGEENYQRLWRPIMRAKFGDNIDMLTAADMWARISRLSASRKADFSQKMGYIQGTPKTLIDRLENVLLNLGVTIHKGKAVQRLTAEGRKIAEAFTDGSARLRSDQWVFTLPLPGLAALLPEGHEDYRNRLKAVRYLDNVSLVLKLTRPLTPYYMLNIQDPQVPFTGIIGLSHIYPEGAFDGHDLFYISRYILHDEAFYQLDKETVLDLYLPHLRRINPAFDRSWIQGYELSKGRNVEPFHHVHYSRSIPSTQTPFDNACLVTSAQVYPQITVLDTAVKRAADFVKQWQESPSVCRRVA